MKFLTVFALLLALAVPTVQAESRDREKPIEIQADHFFGDELKQVATYTGSVRVDQGTMRLTGQKLVLQETAQGYKKGTLTGELATFRQKRDPKTKGIEEWVSGKAEQIVYEERTGIITLTGKALVERSENGVVVKVRNADFKASEALIFIDDKEATQTDMEKIDPDKIERISVYRDSSAVVRYGERGKNGVILIKMKQ